MTKKFSYEKGKDFKKFLKNASPLSDYSRLFLHCALHILGGERELGLVQGTLVQAVHSVGCALLILWNRCESNGWDAACVCCQHLPSSATQTNNNGCEVSQHYTALLLTVLLIADEIKLPLKGELMTMVTDILIVRHASLPLLLCQYSALS